MRPRPLHLAALLKLLLHRPRRALAQKRPGHPALRIPFLLLLVFLDLLPIALFAAGAYLTLGFVGPGGTTKTVATIWINAVVIVRLIQVAGRAIFAADAPRLRLFAMRDASAQYAERWLGRLAAVGIFGYFAIDIARILGLPATAHQGLIRLLGLLLTLLVLFLVYRNRRAVARRIAGPKEAGGRLAEIRRLIGMVWHIPVMLYLFGLYAVWALDIREGFWTMLRGTLLSLVAATVGLVLVRLAERGFRRGLQFSGELQPQLPGANARFRRYLPALHTGTHWVVYLAVGLGVLQAWGLGGFMWLVHQPGRALATTAGSLVATVVVALAVWEVTNLLIASYLAEQDSRGHLRVRSARAKTLLSVARTATTVVLAVVTVLILLSQLGVNIGPLLAAAGVLGVAVGFGSQKLVQDVITGFFILLEDAFAVGDVIQVGSYSGAVEAVSIRNVRLRDLSGTVHTIPFSTISSVSNLTRDFSFHVFDMGIAYREDVDQVMETLRAVGSEMRADRYFRNLILDESEVFGVDSFGDSAVVIKGRIKTRPIKQWEVGREFNRRVKKRFDELGIEIPFPHRTIYFGEDKEGGAPPLHMLTEPSRPIPAPVDNDQPDAIPEAAARAMESQSAMSGPGANTA
jgi:small-conductance mechanosensitive channel